MEQVTINEGIFTEIEIGVQDGEIVDTGSERRNSMGVTSWKKEVI